MSVSDNLSNLANDMARILRECNQSLHNKFRPSVSTLKDLPEAINNITSINYLTAVNTTLDLAESCKIQVIYPWMYYIVPPPSPLPDDYQEVEYVKTTSYNKHTNYFDTGIPMTSGVQLEMRVAFPSGLSTSSDRICGVGSIGWIEATNTTSWLLYNHGTASGLTQGQAHDVLVTDSYWSVDGTTISSYSISSFDTSTNILLFTNDIGAYSDRDGRFELYSCSIYKDGGLVRNYIPCYRKSDNKPGLYDTSNSTFNLFSGSSSIVVGPIVGD